MKNLNLIFGVFSGVVAGMFIALFIGEVVNNRINKKQIAYKICSFSKERGGKAELCCDGGHSKNSADAIINHLKMQEDYLTRKYYIKEDK